MKNVLVFTLAVLASLLLYVGVFSVVKRSLTFGEIKQQLDYKLAYAKALPSPKIIIFAGSNGRYSHRCQVFTEITGRPCINASIAAGIGLDYLFDQYRPILKPGDTIYMPLEYDLYNGTESEMHSGPENAVMVAYQRAYLWTLTPTRIVRAYGSFDLSFLINGLIEMGLSSKGFHRRTGMETLTPQGDQMKHTASIGEEYKSFLRSSALPSSAVDSRSYTSGVISEFLRHERALGVNVIGGLPSVPEQTKLSAEDLARVQNIYKKQGQKFLELPNQSRYPLSCFFDTLYHLNEECQMIHSQKVAASLRDLMH